MASITFRQDIQGLRAIAVLGVVAFHAHVPWLPGGYTGVDIFFVISGFLITQLLQKEIAQTQRIDFLNFYARRLRRLLPAACLVLLAVLIASLLWLPSIDRPSIARDGIFSALYASNIRFALNAVDYFLSEQAPSPLLHYWSLAVEEQFYLFWPILMSWLLGQNNMGGKRTGRRRTHWVLGSIFAVSLIASIILTHHSKPLAFYLPITRIWEFVAGGFVALNLPQLQRLSASIRKLLLWAGLALITGAFLCFNHTMAFPGGWALVPVLGAVGLLIGGGQSETSTPEDDTLISQCLKHPAMGFIGGISYSLYLWHWPVLVFAQRWWPTNWPDFDWPIQVLLMAVCILPAYWTYRFVEAPIHKSWPVFQSNKNSWLLGGGLTAISVMAGVAILAWPINNDFEQQLAEVQNTRPEVYQNGCHLGYNETVSPPCDNGIAAENANVELVLFGDSHAAQWYPALFDIAQQHGWRLVSLTKSSCPPSDQPIWLEHSARPYHECTQWRENVLTRLHKVRPAGKRILVLSGYDHITAVDNTTHQPFIASAQPETILPTWQTTINRLINYGHANKVIILADTPSPSASSKAAGTNANNHPITCLARHQQTPHQCDYPPTPLATNLVQQQQSQLTHATLIDMAPYICPGDGTMCPAMIDGTPTHRDSHHLSQDFVIRLTPHLNAELNTALTPTVLDSMP